MAVNLEQELKKAKSDIERLRDALKEIVNPAGEYYTGLHCGVEDRDIYDRYEAADYGWESAFEYVEDIARKALGDTE